MKLALYLKWIATIITLSGALATALKYDPLNMYLLNLGSIVFLAWAYVIRDKAMMTVNAGLLLIYIVGLAVRV